jgi:hypothetical protein
MSHLLDLDLAIKTTPLAGATFPVTSLSFAWDAEQVLFPIARDIPLALIGAVNTDIMPVGMTKVRLLVVKVEGGILTFKITTADGVAQVIPCDTGLLLWSIQHPITALTVSGTGNADVLVAGE